MADRTVYVDLDAGSNGTGTSGSPYDSMSNMQTDEQAGTNGGDADLTATGLDGILTVYVQGNVGGTEVNTWQMSGWTTDSTHYIDVVARPGEEGDATSDSRPKLYRTASGGRVVDLEAGEFARLEGLEIHLNTSGGSDECVRVNDGADATITACEIVGNKGAADQDGVYIGDWDGTARLRNCVIYGFTRAGFNLQQFGANTTATLTGDCDSCLIYDCDDQASEADGGAICAYTNSVNGTVNITVNNTYGTNADADGNAAAGSSDDFNDGLFDGTHNWSGDYNATSDTSCTARLGAGSGNDNSVDLVDTDEAGDIYLVTELAAGSEDWTPVAPSTGTDQCIEAGSTTLTTDMIGTSRPQDTDDDRGPIEKISAGGGGIVILRRRIEGY